jgi:DNA-directed RNA polymerase sigma subunit (sigma70/sigma32)
MSEHRGDEIEVVRAARASLLTALDEVERTVMQARFFELSEPRTLEETAAALKMEVREVALIEERAMAKLSASSDEAKAGPS